MCPSFPIGGESLHILHPLKLLARRGVVRAEFHESCKGKIGVRAPFHAHDVARRNVADLKHAVIPAGPAAPYHRFRHHFVFETQRKLETRLTRLANLKLGATYAVNVTDAKIRLAHSLDTEILAQLCPHFGQVVKK